MTGLVLASALAFSFGFWQDNIFAGAWMFGVGLIIDAFYDKICE